MLGNRRKFLIASTSVLGAAASAAATLPFIVSWKPNARARALGAPIKLDLTRLADGQLVVAEWRGKPIYVLRRGAAQNQALNESKGFLADPDSIRPNQPAYVKGPARALNPEYTVVVGLCTHLGCAPKYRDRSASTQLGADWRGGFFCPCHGSKFDIAGRVYRNMPAAPNNLEVPPHYYANNNVLVIGEHGANNES
jgi:ubiquinol-cytochrome c reductase iron-sulfur subunit